MDIKCCFEDSVDDGNYFQGRQDRCSNGHLGCFPSKLSKMETNLYLTYTYSLNSTLVICYEYTVQ